MKFYCNPIKKGGDFADPYVLRYNGKYYLYCTNPDIRCWSSENLVDWEFEGPVIKKDTFPSLVPFAPEVVYWNGSFYMYTSPHGRGHYVLKSESPTGPFDVISDNVGHSIDGSVLIDDDGKWYFYWADDTGILGCEMKSPTEFNEPVNTGTFMHGWTEGPQVIKKNGMYYMTYTGNHYLSKGYRINAAISKNPLSGYVDCSCNPIIVHTEEPFVGLGHNSTVYGPDMLTHYIVYHNINPDNSRDLDIDAVVLDEAVRALGPTTFPQPVPMKPDFFDNMNSDLGESNWDVVQGMWELCNGFRQTTETFRCICKHGLHGTEGVIEFNFYALGEYGVYGVTAGNYRIKMKAPSNALIIADKDDTVIYECKIPCEHLHKALHCLQIRYSKNAAVVYIDGRKIAECQIKLSAGDKIGYFSDGLRIAIGYTAFTAGNCASAAERLFIPVPCDIQLNGKEQKRINLNIPRTSDYIFAVACKEVKDPQTALSINLDDKSIKADFLAASKDCAMYSLNLSQGQHNVSFVTNDGLYSPEKISVLKKGKAEKVIEKINRLGMYDKRCFGSIDLPEFEAELEFTAYPKSQDASAGILFRASELADGGEGDDKKLGINFFIGYCVSIENNQITLTKHRYNEKKLKSANVDFALAGKHNLRVKIEVNRIFIYADKNDIPVIEYSDSQPILSGQSGVRVKNCQIEDIVFKKSSL